MTEEKPDYITIDKRTWKAYCYLDEIACDRGYKAAAIRKTDKGMVINHCELHNIA